MVLDHGLDQDEGVQLWHRADRVVDFHLRDLHQLAVLLLRRQRIHPVAGHPIVRLEEDQIGPSAHAKKSEANTIKVLSYDVNYYTVKMILTDIKLNYRLYQRLYYRLYRELYVCVRLVRFSRLFCVGNVPVGKKVFESFILN